MKRVTEEFYCDLCGEKTTEEKINSVEYPVLFLTEQTEGRHCTPYIDYQDIDMCPDCRRKVIRVAAVGCMGFNQYSLIGEEDTQAWLK